MQAFRYLSGVSTLKLHQKVCIGCGLCTRVCPHTVYRVDNGKACIRDLDGCMECGACARNCPVQAIDLNPGVGCAAYIIQVWLKEKYPRLAGAASCC